MRRIATITMSVLMGASLITGVGDPSSVAAAAESMLDPTFGTAGVISRANGLYGPPVAVYGDGSLLVSFPESSPGKIRRYTAHGQLDPTFAPASATPGSLPVDILGLVELDGSGRILATGPSTMDPRIIRYLPDGAVDATFTLAAWGSYFDRFVARPDGSVVALDVDGSGSRVVRFLSNGALDTSFNAGGPTPGVVTFAGVSLLDLQPLADGGVIVVGFQSSTDTRGVVVRLTAAGVPTAGFDSTGALQSAGAIRAVAVDGAGRFVLAEAATGGLRVHRLLANGTHDATFGNAGVTLGPTGLSPSDLVIDSAARPVVTGDYGGVGAAFRLIPSGHPDASFTTGGVPAGLVRFTVAGQATTGTRVFATPDGRVLVSGYTGSIFSGPRSDFVVRLRGSSAATTGAGFNPVAPNRILDTRNGIGAPAQKLAPGQRLRLTVAGTPNIPANGVRAVTMNVTVTQPDTYGYATVFPCDISEPVVSNLNYNAGQDVPNLVTVPVAADGTVCITTSATTHLLADVAGWYGSIGAGFTPVAPNRILDTRNGIGGQGATTLLPGQTLRLRVAGTPSVPLEGATAVTMNVTVTRPGANGYLTVFPCDISPPVVSNLNFARGQDVANLVAVPLPQLGGWTNANHGSVCITTSAATDVLADVAGWFGTTGAGFNPVAPNRILDTRNGIGAPANALTSGQRLRLTVTGTRNIPTSGVSAVTMNVTVTQPQGPGYVTVFPCDINEPVVSNINYSRGQDVPNLVTVPVAADGTVCITTSATTHLIADVAGWYSDR